MTTTFDPASIYAAGTGTLSGGNLHYLQSGTNMTLVRSLDFNATDKFYFELTNNRQQAGFTGVGVILKSQANFSISTAANVPAGAWIWRDDGFLFNNGIRSAAFGTSAAAGTVLMVACDPATGKLWFGSAGTWFASGNPATGASPAYTGVAGLLGAMWATWGSGTTGGNNCTANFGASAYAYTPPAGFGNLLNAVAKARAIIMA